MAVQKTKKKTSTKPKKKKSKKLRPIAKLICLLMIGVSGYFLFQVFKEVKTTIELTTQLKEVQAKLAEVQEENNYLTEQKQKLQDPDYVESYARGNYMLTKDGEQIFYLPEDDSK